MSFWERNTVVLTLGSILGGVFYFGIVLWQSLVAGAIAPPVWWVYVGYFLFQLTVSVAGAWLINHRQNQDWKDVPAKGDERDQTIRLRSEAINGHVASGLVIGCLVLWFLHQNVALLFHSIVAAMIISELVRGVYQMFSYNRAI